MELTQELLDSFAGGEVRELVLSDRYPSRHVWGKVKTVLSDGHDLTIELDQKAVQADVDDNGPWGKTHPSAINFGLGSRPAVCQEDDCLVVEVEDFTGKYFLFFSPPGISQLDPAELGQN